MNEGVVYLTASILVIVAWTFNSLFIYRYARFSKWQYSLVGRTQMQGRVSMWVILSFALSARWFELPAVVQYAMGLLVYTLLALLEIRMYLVLRYTQSERVSLYVHNYTPIRDWWKKHTTQKEKR